MNTKTTRLIQISILALFLGLLFGLLATPAQAQADNDTADLPNLEQFLDDTIERQLAELDIPGATVAVVAGDQLLLAKGYGYAQLDPNRSVGDSTLFRTGSVGKLMTWTAVMQLVEQGLAYPFSLRLTRWLAVVFGLGFLFFLLALVSVVGDIDPAFGVPRIFFGAPPIVDTILLIPWLLAAVAVGLALSAALLWRDHLVGLWSKVHLSLLTLLAVTAVWWLWQWNLL